MSFLSDTFAGRSGMEERLSLPGKGHHGGGGITPLKDYKMLYTK